MVNKPAPARTESSSALRELDHRWSDGISVTLLWNMQTNRVYVSVLEERHGVAIEFAVRAGDALYAFHHPYAYAAGADDHPVTARAA